MLLVTKTIKTTVFAALLLSLAACTGAKTSPSMLDYSYVPQNNVVSVYQQPGIEDF